MKDLTNKPYKGGKPYVTGTAQKRRREAADKVRARRISRHRAKQQNDRPTEHY